MGSSKRPYHVSVKLGGKIRSQEQLIRKFVRASKEVGIVKEVRDRAYYETKGQKRRRKKNAAKRRCEAKKYDKS